jgi:hypothetical protein
MLMAKDMARMLDPTQLARDVGLTPDPWQAQLLIERPKRCLMLCCRQSAKPRSQLPWLNGRHCTSPAR